MMNKLTTYSLGLFLLLLSLGKANAQNKYFIDGYHGGVWGHYPDGYTGFINGKLKDNPFWKINLEIEPVTWDVAKKNDFGNYQLFQNYLKDQSDNGRIEFVNPSYGQSYLFNLQGESIIRQFQVGIKKIREHFPQAQFLTYSSEEPCFTSALPQILKSLGYKYAALKNPNTCWGGYTRAFGGELVNWIGADNSSLLTVPRYETEQLVEKSTWQTTAWNNSSEYMKSAFNYGIQNPIGMCLQDAGWKNGPWLGQPKNFTYKIWRDYIANIADAKKATNWKFTQEDVQVSLVWGAQILQQMAQHTRKAENHIIMAEKIAAIETVNKGLKLKANQFESAWQNLLLAQHHDSWIVPYNIVDKKKNWNWAQQVIHWTVQSNKISDSLLHTFGVNLAQLQTKHFKVYNTLGQARTELVEVKMNGDAKNFIVTNALGKAIPSQVAFNQKNESIILFVADVPAMGFSTFKIEGVKNEPSAVAKKTKILGGSYIFENDLYKVVFNATKGGVIESLIAKKLNNKQFVDLNKGYFFNEMKGYFFKDGKYLSNADLPAEISVLEDGLLRTKIKIEGKIGDHPFFQMVTFVHNDEKIDVQTVVDWQGNPGIGEDYAQKNGWKAEDRKKAFYNDSLKFQVHFPVNLDKQKLYKNAGYDVLESKLKNTYFNTWDSIKNNIIVNWVDVADEENQYGLAILNDHTTNYSHNEKGNLALTLQYAGMGLWWRNYEIKGASNYHYVILPHSKNWNTSQLWQKNIVWNEPLQISDKNPDQKLSFSLVEAKDKNVEVSSLSMEEDSMVLRLFNTGKNSLVQLQLNIKPKKAELIDLNGKTIKVLAVTNAKSGRMINVEAPQFAIRTIRLVM